MARLPQGVRRRSKDGLLEKRFTLKGQRYSVYAGTTKELYEKEQELRDYIKAGLYIDNKNITLNDFFDKWIESKITSTKGNSVCAYRSLYNNHIRKCMGFRKVVDIERREVLELQSRLIKKLKPVSVNQVINILNIIMNDAIKEEIITKNPAFKIKRIKTPEKATETYHRALTEAEQKIFMKELQGNYYYHFIALMLCTGMRFGEVTALTWQDIDYKNNLIHINKTITKSADNKIIIGTTPKTEAGKRDIPLTETAKSVLSDYKNKYENVVPFKTNYIFFSEYGNPIQNEQINKTIRNTLRVLREQGIYINHFTSHALRDTFATRFIEQGGTMQTLKTILGHEDISITMNKYAHVLPNTKQAEMEKIVIAL